MTEKCCERFFEMPAGIYCGILIREDAAKKLQKILWRQTQEIKEFLTRNMDALESANWTLAFSGTENQTHIDYFDRNSREYLPERIKLFDKTCRLSYVPNVFMSDKTFTDARAEVKAFYEEHYGPDDFPEG